MQPRRSKVLVIDDVQMNAVLLANILSPEYEVLSAQDGATGVKLARKERPDIILLDILMPVMDGYEVCRNLKNNPRTHDIPVIFITSMQEDENELRGLEMGAVDYITKPFNMPIVKRRVETHTALKQARDRLAAMNESLEELVRQRTDELEKANLELQASETAYRDIFENAVEGIFQTTCEGQPLSVNKAMARMFGYDSPRQFMDEVANFAEQLYADPAQREYLLQHLLTEETVTGYELEAKRKGGEHFDIQISARGVIEAGNIAFIEGTILDITERKLRERAERERETALAANQAKSKFLASMSHEIRTPLHSVLGLLSVALNTKLDPEQRDYLETAHEAAGHLLAVVNDILDFSRIEARKLTLELVDFDLRQVMASTIKTLGVNALGKDVELSLDIDPDVPACLKGDPGRLRQVIINMVGNAIKFTDQGSVQVKVALTPQDVGADRIRLRFEIRDTGRGIAPQELETIFESYAQAAPERETDEGAGLGLAISQQLATLMGGAVTAESEQGRGSVFTFTAEFEPGDPAAAPGESPPLTPPRSGKALRILLVDDSLINRKVAELHLRKMGYDVTSAESAADALELLKNLVFDLVLMDVQMPGMDGVEATRIIRNGKRGVSQPNVPIVAMTAHAAPEFRRRCMEAGMNDYVVKPVNFYELATTIHRIGVHELYKEDQEVNSTKILDAPTAMRRLSVDDDAFHDILEISLAELAERKENMHTALQASDWRNLALNAHTAKSTAAAVGASALREAALEVERSAKGEDRAACESTLGGFEKAWTDLLKVSNAL
jgi:PAS domain S-box-containing protein